MFSFDNNDLEVVNKWCTLQEQLDEISETFDPQNFYNEIKQKFDQNLHRSICCLFDHMKNINHKKADVYDQLIALMLNDNADFSQNISETSKIPRKYPDLFEHLENDDFDYIQEFSATHSDFFKNDGYSDYPTIADAAEYGAIKCFKFFYLNGQEITIEVLNNAISSGNLEIIRICGQKEPVDYTDFLSTAISYHHNEIVEWILVNSSREIEINLSHSLRSFNYKCFFKYYTNNASKEMNLHEDLPIIAAAGRGNIDIIKLLVKYGNKIDEIQRNWTPLLMAAKNGQNETITYLLDNGANINHIDDSGWTAIFIAAHAQKVSTVLLLLDRGASIPKEDDFGFSFASYAGYDLMNIIKQHQNSKPN